MTRDLCYREMVNRVRFDKNKEDIRVLTQVLYLLKVGSCWWASDCALIVKPETHPPLPADQLRHTVRAGRVRGQARIQARCCGADPELLARIGAGIGPICMCLLFSSTTGN